MLGELRRTGDKATKPDHPHHAGQITVAGITKMRQNVDGTLAGSRLAIFQADGVSQPPGDSKCAVVEGELARHDDLVSGLDPRHIVGHRLGRGWQCDPKGLEAGFRCRHLCVRLTLSGGKFRRFLAMVHVNIMFKLHESPLTMKFAVLTRSNSCLLAMGFLLAGAGAADAAALAAHRAYYTLEAQRLENGGGISAISGKLAYEITGSECEGYAVSYRIANRFVQGETGAQVTDTQLTAWESGDGTDLDMQQKQFVNSKLESESRVKVKKPAPGKEGAGELIGTETKPFTTVPAALFPTAFQKRLLDVAVAGKSRDDSIVFEGSDGDKAMHVISFVGAKRAVGTLESVGDATTVSSLSKLSMWPITVSYYPVDASGDEQPVYEASFNMLENGVSTDLVMDYGSYALKGTLNKIEMLKQDECK